MGVEGMELLDGETQIARESEECTKKSGRGRTNWS